MDATALTRLSDLTDVRALFLALGYESPRDHTRPDLVAQWRSFRVIGTIADDPRTAARTLARQCAAAAEPALVTALSPDLLVLAAPAMGQSTAPRCLTIHLRDPDPLALDILADLRPAPSSTTLQHALRIRDLLATERAGERFFSALYAMHRRMIASLGSQGSAADRETASLLTLTRVLFLYFVQAKGWLAGRPHFLREQLDGALAGRRHYHRRVLHPLFFGALNRPVDRRAAATREFGAIPYLNGGLFEPHPVERRIGPIVFDNVLWRDVFDTCFERFRFTVREADDVNAIAPDMLGRVFENLMATDQRADSGTFYTPQALVRAMVTSGLRAIAHRPLNEITILDPAAGSGAFLLGALDVLTDLYRAVGDPRPVHRLRRDILRRQLFGVDLNPLAVRLAELRLWLAVIADDPATDPAQVEPLPNLDGIVRQGDALLDPLSAARALGLNTLAAAPAARRVAEARRELFEARGPARSGAVRALVTEESRLAGDLLAAGTERCRAALVDLSAAARGRDLFGARSGLTEPQERRRRQLKGHLKYLRAARSQLEQGQSPFFAFEVHCADVTTRGFDLVVGNPPWVRAERIPISVRHTLKERFVTWRSKGGTGFGHDPDLAVAFVERALELTAPDGAIGLLVPSKLATAGYGTALRALLARDTTLEVVHRVPEGDRAFRAAVYPLAVVTRRGAPPADHSIALGFDAPPVLSQSRLDGAPWVLIPDRQHDAVRRLLNCGEPLGTRVRPALGLKTGADRVFVGRVLRTDDDAVVVELDGEDVALEPDVLRPALRGRDLAMWAARSERVLVYAYANGEPMRSPPERAARWFRRHRDVLVKRADHRDGLLWELFRTGPATAAWRVAWSDLARRPQAVLLEAAGHARAIPLNTCYVAAAPDRPTGLLVAAVLNSTWAAAFVHVSADEARGGYRRVNARVVSRLPLPVPCSATDTVIRLSADAHNGRPLDCSALDEALADALGLAQSDRVALRALAQHPG
jgi:hypothetical protein